MTTYPCPVIFLPGIMGSALRDQYPVDPETVWSPFKLLLKAYDRVTLHPTDPRYELVEPSRVAADQVFGIIYGDLIEEMRHNLSPQADEPVPVFPLAYDWRQPLETVEATLAAFIDEVIDRTRLLGHYHHAGYGTVRFPAKVNLVAHSMGGLIIAGYLQKYGAVKVNKVVTIAAPLRGSLEAVTKTAIGLGALGVTSGTSREREAARITPALYYLLPSFAGAVASDSSPAEDLFTPGSWQPGIVESIASFVRRYGVDKTDPAGQAGRLLTFMLNAARRHRSRVESLTLADPKMWLSIVGVGAKARTGMRISRDSTGAPKFEFADSEVHNDWKPEAPEGKIKTGDNTVPYLGARTSFIPTEQVVCVAPNDFDFWELRDRFLESTGFHSSLPNMNLVQRLAVSHLKDRIYGDIWARAAPDLDPGVSWDPPIAGLKRK
jgi:pimeloyl-ACP methyl ester carboxylesterase